MPYEHTQRSEMIFMVFSELEVSPECGGDGVIEPKATKAAEIQREAVVVA